MKMIALFVNKLDAAVTTLDPKGVMPHASGVWVEVMSADEAVCVAFTGSTLFAASHIFEGSAWFSEDATLFIPTDIAKRIVSEAKKLKIDVVAFEIVGNHVMCHIGGNTVEFEYDGCTHMRNQWANPFNLISETIAEGARYDHKLLAKMERVFSKCVKNKHYSFIMQSYEHKSGGAIGLIKPSLPVENGDITAIIMPIKDEREFDNSLPQFVKTKLRMD